jgi:hypothetical protein
MFDAYGTLNFPGIVGALLRCLDGGLGALLNSIAGYYLTKCCPERGTQRQS